MKKIINGKKYDTDTAQEMGSWCNGYAANDFSYDAQTLYKKRTGEFFLHCEGGPMSPYCTHYGRSRGWGEAIEPLSDEDVKKWAEEHLSCDEYESIFGNVEE